MPTPQPSMPLGSAGPSPRPAQQASCVRNQLCQDGAAAQAAAPDPTRATLSRYPAAHTRPHSPRVAACSMLVPGSVQDTVPRGTEAGRSSLILSGTAACGHRPLGTVPRHVCPSHPNLLQLPASPSPSRRSVPHATSPHRAQPALDTRCASCQAGRAMGAGPSGPSTLVPPASQAPGWGHLACHPHVLCKLPEHQTQTATLPPHAQQASPSLSNTQVQSWAQHPPSKLLTRNAEPLSTRPESPVSSPQSDTRPQVQQSLSSAPLVATGYEGAQRSAFSRTSPSTSAHFDACSGSHGVPGPSPSSVSLLLA